MTTLDTRTAPAADGDAATHPTWCDLTRCTVLDGLPLDGGVHRSRTVRLDAAPLTPFGLFDVVVSLQAHAGRTDVYLAIVIPCTDVTALFPVDAAAVAASTVVQLLGLARDPLPTDEGVTYTHAGVLDVGVREGWADPETDPTRIDWAPRQAAAAIPFRVVDNRPVNPCEQTPIRWGRGELGTGVRAWPPTRSSPLPTPPAPGGYSWSNAATVTAGLSRAAGWTPVRTRLRPPSASCARKPGWCCPTRCGR